MSVEKITSRILSDAQSRAEQILAQAEQEKQQILSDARKNAEESAAQILMHAKKNAQANIQKTQSLADLEGKKATLQTKQDCINKVYRLAMDRLAQMEEKAYFSLLRNMLSNIAPGKPAVLQLSEKDQKRFPQKVWAEFPVTLSETAGHFEAGFILHMGETSINCTFDEIFKSVLEDGKKDIADILFHK